MEEYLDYKTYRIKESLTEEILKEINRAAFLVAGIEKLKFGGQTISFVFNPYLISEDELILWIKSQNLTVKRPNKSGLKKRLEKMADENQKAMGNQPLNCCGLNK